MPGARRQAQELELKDPPDAGRTRVAVVDRWNTFELKTRSWAHQRAKRIESGHHYGRQAGARGLPSEGLRVGTQWRNTSNSMTLPCASRQTLNLGKDVGDAPIDEAEGEVSRGNLLPRSASTLSWSLLERHGSRSRGAWHPTAMAMRIDDRAGETELSPRHRPAPAAHRAVGRG